MCYEAPEAKRCQISTMKVRRNVVKFLSWKFGIDFKNTRDVLIETTPFPKLNLKVQLLQVQERNLARSWSRFIRLVNSFVKASKKGEKNPIPLKQDQPAQTWFFFRQSRCLLRVFPRQNLISPLDSLGVSFGSSPDKIFFHLGVVQVVPLGFPQKRHSSIFRQSRWSLRFPLGKIFFSFRLSSKSFFTFGQSRCFLQVFLNKILSSSKYPGMSLGVLICESSHPSVENLTKL